MTASRLATRGAGLSYTPPTMLQTPKVAQTPTAKWPPRVRELAAALLQSDDSSPLRERARGEVWSLLHSALASYLRHHASRMAPVGREDLEDIAGEKSLDLVRRLESGKWDVTETPPGKIAGFVSAVARNGLADHFEKARRWASPPDEETSAQHAGPESASEPTPQPDVDAESREFSLALHECVKPLEERSLSAWIFRVFFDMPTKKIAAHPEIRLKPAHVDVLMQRARNVIRGCMEGKGFDPRHMPHGAFLEVWRAFRHERTRAMRETEGLAASP